MNCPKKSRLLSHEKSLDWGIVFGLKILPEELLTANILRIFRDVEDAFLNLVNLVDLIRVVPKSLKNSVQDSLATAKTPKEAKRLIEKWEDHIIETLTKLLMKYVALVHLVQINCFPIFRLQPNVT